MATRMYYTVNDGWRYVLFDKYVQDPDGKFDDGNGIPWKSWQDPTLMSGTRIGSIWKAMIDAVSSNQTHNLHERPRWKLHSDFILIFFNLRKTAFIISCCIQTMRQFC